MQAVLFPQRHLFEAHVLADWLSGVLPVGLLGVVAMVRTWVFTSFYVMAEMWGDVVLSLLFWGLANERTSMDDAHILYPLFGQQLFTIHYQLFTILFPFFGNHLRTH
jgi:AAA family ATP:ADP antiporter